MFSVAQLRVFLRALVNFDHYTFDDVAETFADVETTSRPQKRLSYPPSTDYQMTFLCRSAHEEKYTAEWAAPNIW